MKKHCLQRYTVYLLECNNNKFYVGSTKNREQRFQEHQSTRSGSAWTRLHKPIRVLREYSWIPASYYLGMEAQITVSRLVCILH
jgi:predicted GIY-YIG superfamily endonuclease